MREVSRILAGQLIESSIRSGLGYEGALSLLEDIVVAVAGVAVRSPSSPLHRADFRAVVDRLAQNAAEKYKNVPVDLAVAIKSDLPPS